MNNRIDIESLMLANKIRYAEMRLECAKKSVIFWKEHEKDIRNKYGPSPTYGECKHIHNLKIYRKIAQADVHYWEKQLKSLKSS